MTQHLSKGHLPSHEDMKASDPRSRESSKVTRQTDLQEIQYVLLKKTQKNVFHHHTSACLVFPPGIKIGTFKYQMISTLSMALNIQSKWLPQLFSSLTLYQHHS